MDYKEQCLDTSIKYNTTCELNRQRILPIKFIMENLRDRNLVSSSIVTPCSHQPILLESNGMKYMLLKFEGIPPHSRTDIHKSAAS